MKRVAPASRSRIHERSGQAALEMALLLPIMLALIFNFLAVMVVVQVRTQLAAATSLGAEAAVTAKVGDIRASCIYASSTFFQTALGVQYGAQYRAQFADSTYGYTPCPNSGTQFTSRSTVPSTGALTLAPFTCIGGSPNYFNGVGYSTSGASTVLSVNCTGSGTLNFARTPLGFAVPWSPTVTITAVAYPSSARQCASVCT